MDSGENHGGAPDQTGSRSSRHRLLRRIGAALIVAVQLLLIVRAYGADHAFFGFQMFPESSEWQAAIYRELPDGSLKDVREAWPGGYRWGDLVLGRGLDTPFVRHHADTGLASTLDFFTKALEWVAANTPEDQEAVALVADVTTWHNGGSPQVIRIGAGR